MATRKNLRPINVIRSEVPYDRWGTYCYFCLLLKDDVLNNNRHDDNDNGDHVALFLSVKKYGYSYKATSSSTDCSYRKTSCTYQKIGDKKYQQVRFNILIDVLFKLDDAKVRKSVQL